MIEFKECIPSKEHLRRIPVSLFESEDIDSVMDTVKADGAVLIDDEEEKRSYVVMSMEVYTEILQMQYPNSYQEKIKEIEEACQAYCAMHPETA